MIEFQSVTFKHHYDEFALLDDASFVLPNGSNTVLCDVQSGKTSVCKLILGLIKPQHGKIIVDGKNVAECVPDVLFLPKEPTFFSNRTVLFNLEYPSRVRKIFPQNRERIQELAHIFSLENLLRAKVKTLNPSQKRRLALARGLSIHRQTVLFDGFFDNTNTDGSAATQNFVYNFQNVVEKYFSKCVTAVQFTSFPQNAFGHTVVLHDKKCAFEGSADKACKVVQSLCWLASDNVFPSVPSSDKPC